MNSFNFIFSACSLLTVYASQSDTCAYDKAGTVGCDDSSLLIQSKVVVSESLLGKAPDPALTAEEERLAEAPHSAKRKTITVECQYALVEQDDNEETGEAVTYGMCEDARGE